MEKTVVVLPRARILGHIAVISTMTFWAVTFVSTKLLLVAFTPAQILMVRSLLGLTLLFAINPPKRVGGYTSNKDRALVAAAGMMGIFLYYYLENTALVYTSASNVGGVIVATAPFFTLLATHFFLKEDSLKKNYFVGFSISMVGIILLTVGGDGSTLDINFWGGFPSFACNYDVGGTLYGPDSFGCAQRVFQSSCHEGYVFLCAHHPGGGIAYRR